MNAMRATILAAAMAAASLSFGANANAAPVGGAMGKAVSTEQTSNLEQVHNRRYHRRHRYYRRGYRNRGYGHYRGYRSRPGFSIYIGPRYGYGYGRRGWY